ncbi:unnamed protein product [Didymodactylos carnosus]|uniref:G-protein coupled receptors family 1 profile domain-containing protein n=1 Tax=Didymodactylos carnosus TaxID=1234261 RepID=A0A815EH02_9BILA|nr:unnamed protein product [Didymodactylos carnosus]CAF1311311.1 unnamed protein product [Didymodactylos carnosus]CAF3949198.1 unnamed protein product [Didymodactylos carnosus]CAF4149111.1 unnamed protein product [Didymodactylos carnosus]
MNLTLDHIPDYYQEKAHDRANFYHWYADRIIYRVFGPFIAVIGLIGSTMSCLVFYRKTLRKKSCSIYFFVLALADLLCLLCIQVHFVLPAYNYNVLIKSNFFCKVFVFGIYFSFDLANYLLTVCSIDRALIVLCPMKCRKFCSPQIAYIITTVLIIVLALLNIHFLYGFVVYDVHHPTVDYTTNTTSILVRHCHCRQDVKLYEKFFYFYDSYFDVIKSNLIPFMIMIVCNFIIIIRVLKSSRLRHSNRRVNGIMSRKSKRKHEKDRQLTLMLVGSAMAFLFLTLPTEINDIIQSHGNKQQAKQLLNIKRNYFITAHLATLSHLNYAIHFYIYTLTGEVFRQQLIKLWPINICWPYLMQIIQKSGTTKTTTLSVKGVNNCRETRMDTINDEFTL